MRPISRAEEGDIVNGWLEREERRGLVVGQLWYLISMDWWRNWNDYVSINTKVKKKNFFNIIYFSYKLLVIEWL